MDEQYREEVLEENVKYDGKIIKVTQQIVKLPNGAEATRDIVYHSGAVAVMALTPDDKMILTRQWRAPIKAMSLEIPAGKLDERDRQKPLHAAERELNEEVRMQAASWQEVANFYTSIGFADEHMTLFLATDLSQVENELPQDDDENLDLLYVSFDEMTAMFEAGQLQDAKTLMAYFHWQTLRQK
ncbi:NUDIX hydrolase [Weissella ceti]|uniref:NUDIX hydrolase n=1 Tax=Weissella ceti TaxID=759620 RepID=A0ABT3E2J8_9LACO|nr:NUDIX hydrolase [Weissella ceti]MCW0952632.1 NUDIX hydrolase [Weissella ceti]QVK12337.1 NUDIX hydrolase [Weissella ceti]